MKEEKIYHIDIELTKDEINHFIDESALLLTRVSRIGGIASQFNTVWKVHNSIAMAKHAIMKEGENNGQPIAG